MAARDHLIHEEFSTTAQTPSHGLRTVFQSCSLITATSAYTYPRHQHLAFEIIAVDRGRYHCRLNGTELRLRKHQILVVKPGDWHEDFLVPPVGYYGLRVKLEGAALVASTAPFLPEVAASLQVVDAGADEFWPLLIQLRRESELRDSVAPHLQEALVAEFFWRLVRHLPQQGLDPQFLQRADEDRFVAQLQQLFVAHENYPLGIPRMAQRLGISQSSLTAKCRARFAASPAQAFRKFKMERALALLAGTEMSVTEVSNHLGFENPYHFSRLFRKHHGRPPSKV
ncbi:MAG: helix-turn-helix transcriptional regulator [Planctomycetes bacterium]|nr:helix-turn-helix transcriptional regulator [Planctomycetota bacterium]